MFMSAGQRLMKSCFQLTNLLQSQFPYL